MKIKRLELTFDDLVNILVYAKDNKYGVVIDVDMVLTYDVCTDEKRIVFNSGFENEYILDHISDIYVADNNIIYVNVGEASYHIAIHKEELTPHDYVTILENLSEN